MNERVIARLDDLGVSLFRINLSHTSLDAVAEVIDFISSHTDVPICLDTEGAQIRTGKLADGTTMLEENLSFEVLTDPSKRSAGSLVFYPDWVVGTLEIGDLISIDFNDVLVQVIDKSSECLTLRVLNGGVVGSNKAVSVHRELPLPALTPKDRQALKIGAEKGLRHIALSFANHPEDVDEIRAAFGREAFVISKIECRNGLANLEAITARSDAVLIDRGDLSREVPIEQIPRLQKDIIGSANRAGRPVYVATNLLESMVSQPTPTRAEVNDVYNTLVDGADGLVLAAETAIGQHPVGCASMIARLINEFEARGEPDFGRYAEDARSFLIEPHGGKLVRRFAGPDDLGEAGRLPKIGVADTDLMDCQQIANGTYSPLTGFMSQATLESVLETSRLPDGMVWPLPVILQVSDDAVRKLPSAGRIALTDAAGMVRALLDIEQVFTIEPEAVATRWFGTSSPDHPGVARLYAGGDRLIGGAVTLVEALPSQFPGEMLSSLQTRYLFSHKGWSRVVGFHTRNVAHRVHEYLQLSALQQTHADGIFINPVIGPKKAGDFVPNVILESYRRLIESGVYPAGKVVMSGFATYSRFSGPREAVFTALCRKNMGCSHFIVGRDHTGVGDFYGPEETRALFDSLDDLGVQPIFFPAIGYNHDREHYEPLGDAAVAEPISGTQVRAALKNGADIPDWFMRTEIQDLLRGEIEHGRPVFAE